MSRITFTQTQSGINIGLLNQDQLVAFLLYSDKLPSSWLAISAWVTGTSYVVGDKVYDSVSSNFYIANTAHVAAAAFATDVTKWDLYTETLRTFKNLIEVESAGIVKDSADYKFLYYQISEVYRINPNAILSVYIAPVSGNTYDFAELYEIQKNLPIAEKANAIGVFGNFSVTSAIPTAIQTQINKIESELEIKTAAVYFSGNYDNYTDVDSLIAVDFSLLNAKDVIHIATQDGDAYGFSLRNKNLGNVGAALGINSLASISDSIGAYQFNMSIDNYEMRNPILAFNQIRVKDLTFVQKESLNDNRHIIASVFSNEVGTRLYSDKTCVSNTNDYNQVNRNRVWARIFRDVQKAVTPLINAKFAIQTGTGLLKDKEVARVTDIVSTPLSTLLGTNDISDYRVQVLNESNFAVTRLLDIIIEVIPTVINEKITVKLGFAV